MILVAEDTFNRASSSSSLGTADFGGAWSVPMPSPGDSPWGIDSHKAYCVSPSTATFHGISDVPKNIAVVGSTASPHIVQAEATLSTTSPNVGLVAKFVDDNNYLVFVIHNTTFSGSAVFACVGGGYYVLASPTLTVTKGATYTLGLTVGSTYTATVNSTVVASGSLSPTIIAGLSGPSKAGLYLGSGLFEGRNPNDPGDSRFDNFVFGIPDPDGGVNRVSVGMILAGRRPAPSPAS